MASIIWGFNLDANGNITPTNGVAGQPGDCGQIVISDMTPVPATSNDTRAGVSFSAYYIGCCDDTLRWVQTVIDESNPPGDKTVPYNDHTSDSVPPFYFPDTAPPPAGMDSHTSDYLGPCN